MRSRAAVVLAAGAAAAGCGDGERPRQEQPLPAGTPARFEPPLTVLEGRRAGGSATIELRARSEFSNADLDAAGRLRFTRFEAQLGGRPARVSLKQPASLFEGDSDAAEGSYSPASRWDYWLVVRGRAPGNGARPLLLRGCTRDGECDEATADVRFDGAGRIVPTD